MAVPFDLTGVSTLAHQIARHVGPVDQVPPAHLHLWLPGLIPPPAWTVAAVNGVAVTRLLLRRLGGGAQWDGCEVVNLYRVAGSVPESLVRANGDRLLRDIGATDIRSYAMEIAPPYGVIVTRASGVVRSRDRAVRSRFHHYVVNTAAGGALVEQAIAVNADAASTLESDADELTDRLYRSLLASIDRVAPAGGSER